jgi:hypothetical protein
VMIIASTASLNASSRLVVMRVSLESDGCRSRRLPRHRELVSCSRAGSPREWGALADWLARPVAYTAEVHPAVRGVPRRWRYVAEELWPAGHVFTHYRDANLRLRCLCTYSMATAPGRSRTPRPPGSRDTAQRRQLAVHPAGGKRRPLRCGGSRPPGSDCAKPKPEARHREHQPVAPLQRREEFVDNGSGACCIRYRGVHERLNSRAEVI